jgi:bifunctional DNase/RNase
MIQVRVDQLFLSNMGFAVLLRSQEDERALPIMIGAAEAQAIALCMNNVEVPRPLTHDLFKNVLDEIGCGLKRMEVCNLQSGTFYARLVLQSGENEINMDSRPSDAIALALRFGAPMFVEDTVMAEAGRVFNPDELAGMTQSQETPEPPAAKKPRRKPTRLENLQREMQKAIEEERYEDCARLRDEIGRASKKSSNDNTLG